MPRWSQASRSVQRRTRKENSFLLFSKSAIYRTCWLPPSEYCPFAPTYTSTYTPAHPFPVCPCVFRGYFFQWVGVACVGHSFTAHLFFKELYVFLVITQPQLSITTPSPPLAHASGKGWRGSSSQVRCQVFSGNESSIRVCKSNLRPSLLVLRQRRYVARGDGDDVPPVAFLP